VKKYDTIQYNHRISTSQTLTKLWNEVDRPSRSLSAFDIGLT